MSDRLPRCRQSKGQLDTRQRELVTTLSEPDQGSGRAGQHE